MCFARMDFFSSRGSGCVVRRAGEGDVGMSGRAGFQEVTHTKDSGSHLQAVSHDGTNIHDVQSRI